MNWERESDKVQAWRAWWDETRNTEPEEFFASVIFRREEGKISGVNECIARVLAQKYPQRFRQICQQLAESDPMNDLPDDLAEALVSSPLPP